MRVSMSPVGLNPLTSNHTAMTISWRPIGMLSTVLSVENPKSLVRPEFGDPTGNGAESQRAVVAPDHREERDGDAPPRSRPTRTR